MSVAYLYMRQLQLELCKTCEALLRDAIAWPKLGHAHFQLGRPSHCQPFQTALYTIPSPTSHTERPSRSWAKRKVTGILPHAPRSSLFRVCAHSRTSAGGPAS